jgi:transketolase
MLPHILLANAIRVLSMDAVQKANSGHPGMPMGMADIAEVLWNRFLQHNPANPIWPNRDRFILSNGHGSMLQYALLHLTGYDVSIEDIKQFRQLHSKTPGHPEYNFTPGVETTTGPLGQGLANAVGMAVAERVLAAQFNREHYPIINHHTYCFVGDGCLMEGISHEVGSLAGTLGLGKLIVFWDDNGISIDGKVSGWFLDNTPKRFEAYGWQVVSDVDGHDPQAVERAIHEAQLNTRQPTLICCQTTIGYGSPTLAGSEKCHGAPLGASETEAARQQLGWEHPPFTIPADIYHAFDAKNKGAELEQEWRANFEAYSEHHPLLAQELQRRWRGELPSQWSSVIEMYIQETNRRAEGIATRRASQNVLTELVQALPELFGGSADLSESNLTYTHHSKAVTADKFEGNYLYYGVREFGMSAMMNGMALYKGFIPYGGTFLTFLDYARNAVRLAAIMKQRVIFVYTHDSIGLGEDGPTHQPVEHIAMLRATPNMSTWRPCDATETAVAWKKAIERQGPTSLVLTRQTVPHQPKTSEQVLLIERGAYILWESQGPLDAIIIATGSEVSVAIAAAQLLHKESRGIRVVSMPSMDAFEAQSEHYRERVLPKLIKARVSVEAATTTDWHRWVGLDGAVVGVDRFGESAPGAIVMEALGITSKAVVDAVQLVLAKLEQSL